MDLHSISKLQNQYLKLVTLFLIPTSLAFGFWVSQSARTFCLFWLFSWISVQFLFYFEMCSPCVCCHLYFLCLTHSCWLPHVFPQFYSPVFVSLGVFNVSVSPVWLSLPLLLFPGLVVLFVCLFPELLVSSRFVVHLVVFACIISGFCCWTSLTCLSFSLVAF